MESNAVWRLSSVKMNKEMRPETPDCTEQISLSGFFFSHVINVSSNHVIASENVSYRKDSRFIIRTGEASILHLHQNTKMLLSQSLTSIFSDSIGPKLLQHHSISPYYKQQLVAFYTIFIKVSLTVSTRHEFW